MGKENKPEGSIEIVDRDTVMAIMVAMVLDGDLSTNRGMTKLNEFHIHRLGLSTQPMDRLSMEVPAISAREEWTADYEASIVDLQDITQEVQRIWNPNSRNEAPTKQVTQVIAQQAVDLARETLEEVEALNDTKQVKDEWLAKIRKLGIEDKNHVRAAVYYLGEIQKQLMMDPKSNIEDWESRHLAPTLASNFSLSLEQVKQFMHPKMFIFNEPSKIFSVLMFTAKYENEKSE